MAKILKIYPDNPQENYMNEVIKTLQDGGLIIYPSDTVYALGCDIYNVKAMEKLARLKNTTLDKAQFLLFVIILAIFQNLPVL